MNVIFMLGLLFLLYTIGDTSTDCYVAEWGKLYCKFSKDISSTQTDFTVYFHSDNGHEELLVDCIWVDDELQCLAQEGFECKQPVSEIAEISVPTRFVSRPGTYKCVADGLGHGNAKHCQFYKSQQETQQGNKYQEFTESVNDNHSDNEAAERISRSTLGAVLGPALGVIVIIIILTVACRNRNIHQRKRRAKIAKFNPNGTTYFCRETRTIVV